MAKRNHINDDQLGFTFDPPKPASSPASLAGLGALACRAVATMLHDDERTREVIAAEVSVLLDDDVSKAMLDAYASPAREGHRVSVERFLALVAVCNRHDLADMLLRQIGGAVLVGEEVNTARLGHIDRQMARLAAERKSIAGRAPEIRGNGVS